MLHTKVKEQTRIGGFKTFTNHTLNREIIGILYYYCHSFFPQRFTRDTDHFGYAIDSNDTISRGTESSSAMFVQVEIFAELHNSNRTNHIHMAY